MTIQIPTQMPTEITVPDALVTGAKVVGIFYAVFFALVLSFIAYVAFSIFRSRARRRL